MAGNHDAKFRQLKKFMEDACYTYTDEWLEACMEWVHENFPNVRKYIFYFVLVFNKCAYQYS